ncbi:hypothetical protein SAMN04487989_102105 [Bizionia echini]|uniref:DUF2202 domain-containing protein n=1 Tax=Bizionia echini TaxID=649333 RepID=A0A1I5AJT8_9FLAO|nr:DUF2202 domain-containing protein [Bizionia echini]SFN62705.1 hypothetical protein SAMN04487989_102105 [Bizionia echini]
MKKSRSIQLKSLLLLVISFTFIISCNDSDDILTGKNQNFNQILSEADIEALLFMLEEEKLARDTYTYLNDLWSINQFANIKNSEQSHMNAIENQLIKNNIDYTILPDGEFANQELQDLYNQFFIDGAISPANAFQIGATIEDLDIVDLQDYINATSNTTLLTIFGKLQCGSRNHLRSFVSGIENNGTTYTPQFLSQDAYNMIISSNQETCN